MSSICLIFPKESWIFCWKIDVCWLAIRFSKSWQVGEKQLSEKQPSCRALYLECSKPVEEWLTNGIKRLAVSRLYPVVSARPHEYIDMDGFLAPWFKRFWYFRKDLRNVSFVDFLCIDFLRLWFQRINLWKVLTCALTNFQFGWPKWKAVGETANGSVPKYELGTPICVFFFPVFLICNYWNYCKLNRNSEDDQLRLYGVCLVCHV